MVAGASDPDPPALGRPGESARHRRVVPRVPRLTAIAADPNEASLHQLLGHVYDRMGVKGLAIDAVDEARFLSAPRP
ncbi:MAG TPA: hypothetical protein VFG27_14610 [Pseudomonadales bacterium]|nr:hypothetical protein [Pseudomonadales bacterium]